MICLLLGVMLAAPTPEIECKLLDEFTDFQTTTTGDAGEWIAEPEPGDLDEIKPPLAWLDESLGMYYIEGDDLRMVPIDQACDFTTTNATAKHCE